jgi:uncharacterized cupin superfamily protein
MATPAPRIHPIAALQVAERSQSNYPEPFASRMHGRSKRALGDVFGLSRFGVNLTTLQPGAVSALQHRHSVQEEFVYVIAGSLILKTDHETVTLDEGMCVGFVPSSGVSHQLMNTSNQSASYLEVGDRHPGDAAQYPNDDLQAVQDSERWVFLHKDGRPYP